MRFRVSPDCRVCLGLDPPLAYCVVSGNGSKKASKGMCKEPHRWQDDIEGSFVWPDSGCSMTSGNCVMGRSKFCFFLYYTYLPKTVSSSPSSTRCDSENTDCNLYNHLWVMSQCGGCLCDPKSCMHNSLKDRNRPDEATGVEPCPANSCMHDNSCQTVCGTGKVSPLVSLLPTSLHLPTALADQSTSCRLQDPYSPGDHRTKHQLHKRPCETERDYNLRPRKCTCMGWQSKVHPSKEDTRADLSEDAALMAKSGARHNLQKKKKDPEDLGIDSPIMEMKESKSSPLAQKQASLDLAEENYPAAHMTREEFFKNCGLVKMHSVVCVKQEIEPMELDLECQIVGVEVPLPAPPRVSPNSRSLISSIKRENCEPAKARKCLHLSVQSDNSEDSDFSSDSGIAENSVGRPMTCRSLLCIDISSPLGQRVKKFTKADLVRPPLTDIEQYCMNIPEEDEVRFRLRQRETYPVKLRQRMKDKVTGYCHTYKFSYAERRRYIRNVFKTEIDTKNQGQQQQMKKCWVHLPKLNAKQIRRKTLRKKTILNQELTIDNDISIVRMDVPEQLFNKMQKMPLVESSSRKDQESQLVVDVETVVHAPEHSDAALRPSSTGIRKGLPRYLRPCPKSERKQQFSHTDHAEEMVIDSVSSSSEEDVSVERQRAKHKEFQPESEEVQIVSVSGPRNISSISSEKPPIREGLVGATDSRMATSSDVTLSSSAVEVSQNASVQTEPAVCSATHRHLPPAKQSVSITTSSVSFQDSVCTSSSLTRLVALTTVGAYSISGVCPVVSVPSSAEHVPIGNNSPLVPQNAVAISGGDAEQRTGLAAQNRLHSIPVAQSVNEGSTAGLHENEPEVQTGLVSLQSSHLDGISSHTNDSYQQIVGQTPADLQSYPVIQNVYSLQTPPVVEKTADARWTVTMLQDSPAVFSNTSPQMCPDISGAPVGNSVPVMPDSSMQRVPVAFPSPHPNPQTSAVPGATVVYGNDSASGKNLPPVHSLPEAIPLSVPITPGRQPAPFLVTTCGMHNLATVQNTVCVGDTTCLQNHSALPSLPFVVNASSVQVIPEMQTVLHSVHMTPHTQNSVIGTKTATQHTTMQNTPGTVNTANSQTIPAAASVQLTPQVTCSTNWHSTLQVQNIPLVPNAAGAHSTGVGQDSPQVAQPVSMPKVVAALRVPHQTASMPDLSQSQSATQSPISFTPSVLHVQSIGQMSPLPNVAGVQHPAQICYVQNSPSVANPEQTHSTPHAHSAVQTSMSQAFPYVQGTVQSSVSHNIPNVQGSIQTSLSPNTPYVQGSVQTSVSPNTPYPYVQGSVQASVSHNLPFTQLQLQGIVQTSMTQNTPYIQGCVQTSMPPNTPYVQGSVQTSVPPNTPYVHGSIQTSVPPNTPYVQGCVQTSVSPNTPYVQGCVQTSVPPNTPYVHGSVQTSVSPNTPYVHGCIQTSLPQNTPYVHGSVQTSVPPNTPYVHGSVQTSVPPNTPYVHGSVQTSVPPNTPYVQGCVQTSVPSKTLYVQGCVQTSVPPNTQSILNTTMQTTPYRQTTPQSVSRLPSTTTPFQNTPRLQSAPLHSDPHQSLSNFHTTSYAQNSPHPNPTITGNTPGLQHNAHISIANTQVSSHLPATCSSTVSCCGVQSVTHLQTTPVQSCASMQSTSTGRAGQLQQTRCSLNQGVTPSTGTVGDEDSPEELRKKLSVFNLIPNRFPVTSPSKQPLEKTTQNGRTVSCGQTSEGSNSELRISAVYGAAELASMFPNNFSESSSSSQPPERTAEGNQNVPCAKQTEDNSPQLCIGAVYGAAELANSHLAASLGLDCPQASQSRVGQGSHGLSLHPQNSHHPQTSQISVSQGSHVLPSHQQNSHSPQTPHIHVCQGSSVLPIHQQISLNAQATQLQMYQGSSSLPSHQQASHHLQSPHVIPTQQQTSYNPPAHQSIATQQQTLHHLQTPHVIPTHQQTSHNPPAPQAIATQQQTSRRLQTPHVIPTHQQTSHRLQTPHGIPTHQQTSHRLQTPHGIPTHRQTSHNPPTPCVIPSRQQNSQNVPTPQVISTHQQTSHNPHTRQVISTHQQTSHNPSFRTMQPCYDLTMQAAQQNPVNGRAQGFGLPQPFPRPPGGPPGQRSQRMPAAPSGPSRISSTQHGLSSADDDEDCVEVIYLDDD